MSNDEMEQPNHTPSLPSLSEQEERTWSVLVHLSILGNLITGFLGVIAALVIFLVYRDRSRYVAYQSLQALIFQIIGWVIGGTIAGLFWAFTGILSAIIVGICLIPFAILLSLIPLAAIGYGIFGALKCNQGEDFQYWLIGDWVRETYTG